MRLIPINYTSVEQVVGSADCKSVVRNWAL
jgi:hypothetical protein